MKKVTLTKNQKKERVMYKLRVSEDSASKNMPQEEEFDNDNYETIEEKETAVWRPPILINTKFFLCVYCNLQKNMLYSDVSRQ